MNETHVTLTGWIGGDVTVRRAGEAEVASFRLASTPRRFNRRDEEWFDAPTQWWTVNAWRVVTVAPLHHAWSGGHDPPLVVPSCHQHL